MLCDDGLVGAERGTDQEIQGVRVLVSGACGFIGTNLVEALVDAGAEVVAIDLPSADWNRMPAGVECLPVDLMDRLALETALASTAPCTIVYHLAARTDLDGRKLADYALNTTGTANLIRATATTGVCRFVHYSTQLVAGLFDEKRMISESEPYRTTTVYGDSKVESERVVQRACADAKTEWTIIRPTSVYGPWGRSPYQEFFAQIRSGRYLHVGRADNEVSLVHVQNLVDLTVLLSVHPSAAGEVFFGNDRHPYQMREVVDTAAAFYGRRVRSAPAWIFVLLAYALAPLKSLGLRVPLYPFRLRNIRMTYTYDVSKSLRLGYDPQLGLADGIALTLSWYDAHPEF